MCVCARRQPSPIAAPPDSPWSPVRVSPCPAVSAPGLPPNIVHTVLAAALAIPLAAAPACRIAFAIRPPRASCSSDRPLFCPRPPACASCSFPPPLAPVPVPNPSTAPVVPSRCLFRLCCPSLAALASACALRISYSSSLSSSSVAPPPVAPPPPPPLCSPLASPSSSLPASSSLPSASGAVHGFTTADGAALPWSTTSPGPSLRSCARIVCCL